MSFSNEIRPGTIIMSADEWINLKEAEAEKKLPTEDLGIFSTHSSDVVGRIPRRTMRHHSNVDERQLKEDTLSTADLRSQEKPRE